MTEPHAHDWRQTERPAGEQPWRCAECEATSATCGTCHGASGSSLLLCQRCERRAAGVLDDIEAALDLYEPQPRSLVGSPGDMHLVPGGSESSSDNPEGIRAELLAWVARWTEHAGAERTAATDYLKSRHLWAAHNPDLSSWPVYLEAMRALRHRARRLAGLLPKRLPEPCVHCGGDVVQDWADQWWKPLETGLSDVVRCTGCGTTWGDHAHWLFSTRQHVADAPAQHPDSLITLAQARMIWREVPAATWRKWAQRWRDDGEEAIERARHWWDLRCAFLAGPDAWPAWAPATWQGPGDPPSMPGWLPDRGVRKGEVLYRVGDLAALVQRWADESRPGRRSSVTSERMGA